MWPWMSDAEVRAAEWERWLEPVGVERPVRDLSAWLATNTSTCGGVLTREVWDGFRERVRRGEL